MKDKIIERTITNEGFEDLIVKVNLEDTCLFSVYLEDGVLAVYPTNDVKTELFKKGISAKSLKYDDCGAPLCEVRD